VLLRTHLGLERQEYHSWTYQTLEGQNYHSTTHQTLVVHLESERQKQPALAQWNQRPSTQKWEQPVPEQLIQKQTSAYLKHLQNYQQLRNQWAEQGPTQRSSLACRREQERQWTEQGPI
jgi:hypothetical protein